MSTVQTVAYAFNMAAKRLLSFQEALENDPVSQGEKDERQKTAKRDEWHVQTDSTHFLARIGTIN